MRINKILATLAVLLLSLSAIAANPPKYIFYFIGDGMGLNHVVNADIFNRQVLGADSSLTMLQFPVASMARTHSASSKVTDSAAAGTALATGHKTLNSMLGMNPDTVALRSMARELFDRGWGIGLVTTVGIDDATPGAFYANVPSRHERHKIAEQLARSGFQFAAGAGLAAARDTEGESTGLLETFAEEGVTVAYGLDGLEVEADRLLVLSPDTMTTWNVGYTIDSIPGALTLPAMTAAGIRQLSRLSPDRFFMMIEGGNIDHAGHANDGGTIVREVVNFDQAIRLAWNFYLAHPRETLIVVTADHETGGMSVGTTSTGYAVFPDLVASQKVSKEQFTEYIKSLARSRMIVGWDMMEAYLRDNLGLGSRVKITNEQTDALREMFENIMAGRNSAPDQETLYATFDGFTAEVFRLINDAAGYGFPSTKHTGAMVPVFAVGEGAEIFSSLNDNTDIPRKILTLAGLSIE